MPGPKTNEREGTKAVLRYCGTSAFKVRPVLDLIRDKTVAEARDILRFSERDAARIVGKLLDSAIANAEHNDSLDPEELFVSACFADEGMTHKRWRPRARGRATRIRKRTSHITVIVSRLPEDKLVRLRAKRAAETQNRRARRVAGGRAGRRTRRDEQMPGTTEPVATEAAEVVDSTTAEQEIAEQDAAVESEAVESEAVEATEAEPTEGAAQEASIVDQQEAAVEQAEAVTEAQTDEEEGE
jgi:large subunit ribosomal protein L22